MKAWQELVDAFRNYSLAEVRKLLMAALAVVLNVAWFAVGAGLVPAEAEVVKWFLGVVLPLVTLYGSLDPPGDRRHLRGALARSSGGSLRRMRQELEDRLRVLGAEVDGVRLAGEGDDVRDRTTGFVDVADKDPSLSHGPRLHPLVPVRPARKS
jgi:hypothetical protein